MKKLKHLQTTIIFVLTLVLVFTSLPTKVFADGTADVPAKADKSGELKIYSTVTPDKILKDTYCFSDEWFLINPEAYNPGLALLSMQLTAAAGDDKGNGPAEDFLESMGFSDIHFKSYNSDFLTYCNYTYGKKVLRDGSTLLAVSIENYTFDLDSKIKGWKQNFFVNGEEISAEHYAYDKAVDAVIDDVAGLGDGSDKVRFWITGQSRGGTLTNLLAARLPAKLDDKNKGIYAYTFEAPAVIEPEDENQKSSIVNNYRYIHNYICSDDLVAMLPPWGMMRYGVTYELDTDETNANLQAQLDKLGSQAVVPKDYDKTVSQAKVSHIVESLESAIPTREDYSTDHKETIQLDNRKQQVTYNYQKIFEKLMDKLFSDTTSDFSLDDILGYQLLSGIFETYIRAYLKESGTTQEDINPYRSYWEIASTVSIAQYIPGLDMDFELDDQEIYAILKLLAPILIDKDAGEKIGYNPETDGKMSEAVIKAYLAPAYDLPSAVFSHHFDMLIGRLKTLASAQEIENNDTNPGNDDHSGAENPTSKPAAEKDKEQPSQPGGKESVPAFAASLTKGITAVQAENLLTSTSSNNDPQGARYLPLKLKSGKTTKNSIKLSWAKAADAQSYDLYGALSGKNRLKKIASVSSTSYTVKKAPKALKKGKYYKFIVLALDKDKKLITASSMIHAATAGSKKAGNCKSLTIGVKKAGSKKFKTASSLILKNGKTAKLKVKITADKNISIKKILKTRYASSNPAVATVSSKGKIKAAGKGKCDIWVYAQNGCRNKVKVTVK